MCFTVLIPETKRMHLDVASSKSTSLFGRRMQKDAACPLYEAESRSSGNTSASSSDNGDVQ